MTRDVSGKMGWYLVQTSVVTLLFQTLREFGKGVFRKRRFHVEVPWDVPFLFRRQKGTCLGTQAAHRLKLLL